jgi:hypothetical protein
MRLVGLIQKAVAALAPESRSAPGRNLHPYAAAIARAA